MRASATADALLLYLRLKRLLPDLQRSVLDSVVGSSVCRSLGVGVIVEELTCVSCNSIVVSCNIIVIRNDHVSHLIGLGVPPGLGDICGSYLYRL